VPREIPNTPVIEEDFGARELVKSNATGVVGFIQAGGVADNFIYYDNSIGDWASLNAVTGGVLGGNASNEMASLTRVELRDLSLTLDEDTTTVTHNTSTAFADAYAFTLPADHLETDRCIHMYATGDYSNGGASASRLKFRITYGGTTIHDTGNSASITNDGNTYIWHVHIFLSGNASTSAQRLHGQWTLTKDGNAPASGTGYFANGADVLMSNFAGTAVEDSTGALDLDFKMRHTVSHASTQWQFYYGFVEIL
jgi:hypothetical protein